VSHSYLYCTNTWSTKHNNTSSRFSY